MPHHAPDFPAFSRTERLGLAGLLLILALLLLAWQGIPYLLPPSDHAAEDKKLAAAWQSFKKDHLANATEAAASDLPVASLPVRLIPFDPNTIDSLGCLRLGLSPKVVKGWMNWRRHGKHFYKKEDLKPLYNLTEADYARLEPYITIAPSSAMPRTGFANSYAKLPPLPATLDLNTTDSATIVRLNGIGPTLAHKIIARRNALGGFLRHEQLLEVYKFSDSTFTMLQQRLIIRVEAIRKIKVNEATLEDLKAHPYIGEKMAPHILLLRNGLKRFQDIRQLRQVPLMNEENYRKIAPYLAVD